MAPLRWGPANSTQLLVGSAEPNELKRERKIERSNYGEEVRGDEMHATGSHAKFMSADAGARAEAGAITGAGADAGAIPG